MPAKKETVPELDDILAEMKAEEKPKSPTEEKTRLNVRIAELEQLLQEEVEPKKISPEELRVHELEGLLMQKQAIAAITAGSYEELTDGDKFLMHVLEPNTNIAGHIWNRGDELLFTVGDSVWNEQFDRNGDTWIKLVFDEEAQIAKFGSVRYLPGPWTGPTQVKIPRGATAAEAARLRESAERIRLAKRDLSSRK